MRCLPPSKSRRVAAGQAGLVYAMDGTGPRRTFAGDAGDVADLTGRNPAGVRGVGVTWGATPRGPGLLLNGTANGMNVGVVTPANGPFSILWSCYLNPGNSGEKRLVNFGSDYNGNGFYCSNYNGFFYVTAHTSGVQGAVFPLGAWHDCALTYDGSSHLTLWLDGSSTVNGSTTITSTAIGLSLGSTYASSYAGQASNLTVWNRSLPIASIAAYFADPTALVRDRSHY